MFADHSHGEIGAVLPAKFFGQSVTQVPGLVGELAHLPQQFFPVVTRQTLVVPIGACMLTAMIEEALVIVFGLKRLDFLLDESIQHTQIVDNVLRHIEVHSVVLPFQFLSFGLVIFYGPRRHPSDVSQDRNYCVAYLPARPSLGEVGWIFSQRGA